MFRLNYGIPKLKLLLALWVFHSSSVEIYAQGFELTFGGPGTQICNDMVIGSDSSIYLLGYSSIGPLGGNDFMISKVSLSGQHLWTKYLGTAHDDEGVSILMTAQQELVLAGNTHDTILNAQVLIVVTDTSGVEISRHTFGTIETEHISSAQSCPDGGYLVAGYQTWSGVNYAYLLKLDSGFSEQWSAPFGIGINDYASEAIMTDSNTCYLASDRRFNLGGGSFDYDVSLIRTDSTGVPLWDSVYQESFQNGSQGIIQNQSGNLVFFGETEIFQFSAFDYFIAAANPNGQLLWRYTFGGVGSNALFDALEDASGNYIATGYGNSFSSGTDPLNLSIIKIDTLGNLIWQREYGFQGVDVGFTILEAAGSGYYVSGRASTIDDDDFYLLKVDTAGLTSENEIGIDDGKKLNIFPNPFDQGFNISSPKAFSVMKLFDASGRLVYETRSTDLYSNRNQVFLPYLAPGVYIAEILQGNLSIGRSLIVKR